MGQTFTGFDEQQGSCFKLKFREPVRHFPIDFNICNLQ